MCNERQAGNSDLQRPGNGLPAKVIRFLTTGLLFAILPACGSGGDNGGFGGNPNAGGGTGNAELSTSSFNFSPSQVSPGDVITVLDQVLNTGSGTASNFQVGYYLSSDAVISTADTLIGSRPVGVLVPNASSNGSGLMTVPSSLPEGDWFVGSVVDVSNTVTESNEGDNMQAALQVLQVSSVPAPDLVPTQVTFDSSSVLAGQSIGITDTVQNIGVGDSTSFQVGIYLSQDAEITSGDVLLGLRSVPALAPSESSFLSAPLTVPANTAAGSWMIGVLVDVNGVQVETDEFNNSLVATGVLNVTQPPRPDLRMVSLSFSPAQLDAGQSLTISESVVNQGLVDAGAFRVGVFISEDAEITTADTLLGFRALGGLLIGEQSPVSAPLVVPASLGSGEFYVGAIVDHEDDVLESDEENNSILALGTVLLFVPPLPDLATVAVSFSPSVAQSGDTITVVERIRNDGNAAATNFRVATYLSTNASISTSDVLLGSRMVTSLAVGAENDSLNAYPLPPGLGSGSYTLGVIVDDLMIVQEPDEGNNLLAAPGLIDITGSAEAMPDLIVELLTGGPASIEEGGQLSVQSTIRNQGDLSAGLFKVDFYLSTDDIMEATDHLVGTRTISSLAIGGGSAQSFPYTLDLAVPLGSYHFGAICDATSVIPESDEGNNSFVIPGLIEVFVPPPPAPDLSVTAVATDITSLVIETAITFNYTIKNLGNLDAGAAHVDFYFSSDTTIDNTDILVGASLVIPSLAIDAESPGSVQITIPAAVTVATWSVGAIVVIDSGPVDSNTSNDARVAASTVDVTF
jgi:subtilase family serine protease